MGIVAVAILSPTNKPILLETVHQEDHEASLRLHFLLHCSVDVIEESLAKTLRQTPEQAGPNGFLGEIADEGSFRVFGMVGTTRKRFLIVVDSSQFKDDQAKEVLSELRREFTYAACNPFCTSLDEPLQSEKLSSFVTSLVNAT